MATKAAKSLPSAIKSMWDAEEALSIAQRRERYKCGKKFTIVTDIVRWESQKTTTPAKDQNTPVSENKIAEKWFHKYFDLSPPNIYSKWKEDPVINSKVALWAGNITALEIDAILNAANTSLLGGGGVDGAIHSAAGKQLLSECRLLNGCNTGEAKITRGYRLPAKYVIATVGPVGEKPELLRNAYHNSLEVAKKYGIRTFALCGVSTGVYGYPLLAATHIAMATVRSWLEKNKKHVDLIVFCNFLPREVACYESLMPLYFPRSSVIPVRPIPAQKAGEEEGEEEAGEEAGEGEGEGKPAGEKAEGEKAEGGKTEGGKAEAEKIEGGKVEGEKVDVQKVEAQKVEEQKTEEQKVEEQKVEEQKVEEQKVEEQKVEEQKVEEQKVEEQKGEVEEQKVEEQGDAVPATTTTTTTTTATEHAEEQKAEIAQEPKAEQEKEKTSSEVNDLAISLANTKI